MLKKKLVTIVAAVFCVALVTAQQSGVNAQQSGVNKVTTGLIEDGAIDSLKFGTEDGSGVIFGQYDNAGQKITLGWGNSLSDTLWLSVFDSWYFRSSNTTTTDKAQNDAHADDTINVDYTKTTRETDGVNSTVIKNDLGIGLGINNTLGFQLVWGADYTIYKNPANITGTAAISANDGANVTIKSEVNDPNGGIDLEPANPNAHPRYSNVKKEWTKYTNNNLKNNFTVNFKGVGVEDIGDIAFFVKLNKVYFNWTSINRTGDYTESRAINGKTVYEETITGKNTENTIQPGINFDLGLNVIDNDVATVKFVYEDEFNMSFKPRTNESSKTTKNPVYSTTEERTTTNSYKVEAGKYLTWSNKFEPKLDAEFNVAEPLKLKAQLALPVTLYQQIDEVGKYESTTQTDTFNRTYGYTRYTKTTTTGKATNSDGDTQNKEQFVTFFAPKLSAGFVYEVTPGKFNVNFGVAAQPNYTWMTTTKTNPNINTIQKSETKSAAGNVTSSVDATNSTFGVDNNVQETKVTEVQTNLITQVNLGATWFFTDKISFDVYFLNSFGTGAYSNTNTSTNTAAANGNTINTNVRTDVNVNADGNIFGTSQAGASVTVRF